MTQRVQISIKYKFLAVLASILLVSVGLFFYFVQKTFSDDKKLFVMDYNLTLLRAASSEIKLELRSRLEELQLFIPRVYSPLTEVEKNNPYVGLSPTLSQELLGVSFYRVENQKPTLIKQYKNRELFGAKKVSETILEELNAASPINLAPTQGTSLDMKNRSLRVSGVSGGVDLSVISFTLNASFLNAEAADLIIVVDMVQDFLRRRLSQSEIAEMFLVSKSGLLLSHGQLAATVNYAKTPYPHPAIPRLQARQLPREALELDVSGVPYLCNIAETGFNDIFVISQIKKSQVFQALYVLLEKGLLLAALIMAVAMAASVIFAHRLTVNIRKLKYAAEQIGTGNFKATVQIETNDEIQSVSDSFNWMVRRLKELIEESAQKARMEDELETARLVQSTLLKTPEIPTRDASIISHYHPATECGGDFWDAYQSGDKLTVLIGDATGHGAPAAIITAVAKSCFSTLNAIYAESSLTPEQFLLTLNRTIFEACQGKLLMTMVMLQLDLTTGELLVCNAGHESPMLASRGGEKKGVEVLFARGERLGFNLEAEYETARYQMTPGDTLLLYTDGVSEARNGEGKEWGERALKKAFGGETVRTLEQTRDGIIEAMNSHTSGAQQEDDVTFVLVTWKQADSKKQAA